jgi:hypothetical protein
MGQASKRGLIYNGVAHGRWCIGNGLAEEWERRYMGQASKRGLIYNGVAHGRWCIGNGLAEEWE